MDKLKPIPDYPGMQDMKKYNEWLEQLKQRLRDAGQNVEDDPLHFKEIWPRPLPYQFPNSKHSYDV
jgi:hypothetical protein